MANIKNKTFDMSTSDNANEFVDILPSFDFFNKYYINVPVEDDENRLNLPDYEEIDRPAFQRPSAGTFESALNVDSSSLDNAGNGVMNAGIDSLHKLPEVPLPLTIEIYPTPNPPKFGQNLESSNLLKEYTCGDLIHGMILIRNDSDKPMRFEMFYVTLEGTAVVVDRFGQTRSSKNILRMADMSACYADFPVESPISKDWRCGQYDANDRTTLGLDNTKVLEPHRRYKKFFSFKVPDTLLESQCPHGISAHSALPPSMGIDKHGKGFAYSGLKMNHLLGYARPPVRGAPIWVDDLAEDDVCVNYSINATMVGKNSKTKELLNMKRSSYSVRVIPTSFESISKQRINCSAELNSLIRETESSISKLELVRTKFDENGFVTNEDLGLDSVSMKERQLRSHTKSFDAQLEQSSHTIESDLVYRVEPKWLAKFSKSAGQMAGVVLGSIQIPRAALPYRPPPMIARRNSFHTKTKYEQENIVRLSQVSGDILENLEIELECIPAVNSNSKPPSIEKVSAVLISITGSSKRAIPLRLSNSVLLNERKILNIRNKFRTFEKRLQTFKSWFTDKSTHIETSWDQIVSKPLLPDVISMANLNIKVKNVPILVNQISPATWNSQMKTRVAINLKQPIESSSPVILPSFANCMCFRFYTLRLQIKFDHSVGVLQMDVPIDVRNIVSHSN